MEDFSDKTAQQTALVFMCRHDKEAYKVARDKSREDKGIYHQNFWRKVSTYIEIWSKKKPNE